MFGIANIPNLLKNPAEPNVDPLAYTWSGLQDTAGLQEGTVPLSVLMAGEVVPQGERQLFLSRWRKHPHP